MSEHLGNMITDCSTKNFLALLQEHAAYRYHVIYSAIAFFLLAVIDFYSYILIGIVVLGCSHIEARPEAGR
jgi:hypothetical protein